MRFLHTSFLLLICLITAITVDAATIRSNQSGGGAWGNGTSWTGGASPGPGDDVVIRSGDNIQLNQDISVASINIKGHFSGTTTLEVTAGNTLTVNGNILLEAINTSQTVELIVDGNVTTVGGSSNFVIDDNGNSDFTADVSGSGVLTISNLLRADIAASNAIIQYSVPTIVSDYARFAISGGGSSLTVNLSAGIGINNSGGSGNVLRLSSSGGAAAADLIVNLNSGTNIDINGSIVMQGSGGMLVGTVGQNSTVNHTGGTILTHANVTYHDLSVSNSQSLAADVDQTDILGDLIISGGGVLNTNGHNITLGGNLQSTGQLNSVSGSGDVVTFAGAGAQAMSGTNNLDILVIDNANGVSHAGTTEIFSGLEVADGSFTNSGSVTLVSTASRTANLLEMGAGASCGSITANRYIANTTALGWRHFTSPIQGSTLQDFQDGGGSSPNGIFTYGYPGSNQPSAGGQFSTYTYDGANVPNGGNFDLGWENATNASNSLSPFVGTIFYSGGNGTSGAGSRTFYDLSVTGTPYQGNVTMTTGNSNLNFIGGAAANDWNLIGNPYASTIDWSTVQGASSNIGVNAYIYSPSSGYQSTATFSDEIASFQSFWVKTTGGGPTVNFQESAKVNGQRAIQKAATYAQRERVYINLKKDSAPFHNVAVLEFNNQATSAPEEEGFDAIRFDSPYPIPECSFMSQGVRQEVDSRNVVDTIQRIPLKVSLHPQQGGLHTFELWQQNAGDVCLSLYDKLLDSTVYITVDTARYTVYISDTLTTERFEMVVTPTLEVEEVSPASCYGIKDGEVQLNFFQSTQANLYSNGTLVSTFPANGKLSFNTLAANNYRLEYTAGGCGLLNHYFTIQEPSEIKAVIDSKTPSKMSVGKSETFKNSSTGATHWEWDFGNGDKSTAYDATYAYINQGIYTVTLTASFADGKCSQMDTKSVSVVNSTGLDELAGEQRYSLLQNEQHLSLESVEPISSVTFIDMTGRQWSPQTQVSENTTTISLPEMSGVYLISFDLNGKSVQRKFIKP